MAEAHPFDLLRRPEFNRWLERLRDKASRNVIERRLVRLRNGNFGDVRPVGDSVSELRIDFGPGYRIYFVQRGDAIVVLLCGGDKSSQSRDIALAKQLAQSLDI